MRNNCFSSHCNWNVFFHLNEQLMWKIKEITDKALLKDFSIDLTKILSLILCSKYIYSDFNSKKLLWQISFSDLTIWVYTCCVAVILHIAYIGRPSLLWEVACCLAVCEEKCQWMPCVHVTPALSSLLMPTHTCSCSESRGEFCPAVVTHKKWCWPAGHLGWQNCSTAFVNTHHIFMV